MISKDISKFIFTFQLKSYLLRNKIEHDEVLHEENPQIRLHTCPFCKSINHKGNFKADKFYIAEKDKKFICYVCDKKGGLFRLLAALEKLSLPEILKKYLNQDTFKALPSKLISKLWEVDEKLKAERDNEDDEAELEEISMPVEFEQMFTRPQEKFVPAYTYLRERGFFELKTAKSLGQDLDLRYCDYCEIERPPKQLGELLIEQKPIIISKRIILPIYFDNKLVGYQGRDITNKSKIKYYISQGFRKQRIIFNYDKIKDCEEITICEGLFDVIKCWSHNPTCLFGKSLSKTQKNLLLDMPNLKKIYIALDPDTKIPSKNENGTLKDISEAPYYKLIEELREFWEVYEIDLPGNEDCGEQSFENMEKLLINAKQYKKRRLTKKIHGVI